MLTGILLAEISTYHLPGGEICIWSEVLAVILFDWSSNKEQQKTQLREMLCVCAVKMTDYCLIFLLWYLKRWVINQLPKPVKFPGWKMHT